jgi:DNA-binding SARP family transcriptional activator
MTAPEDLAVRVAVLGPTRAWVHGAPVELGGPRQRSVLARLVQAHGQVVSADRLIEDLWQGEPPPKALAALQAYISNLRRALEPDRAPRAAAGVIVSAAPGYCLRLPAAAVDAWQFEASVVAAEDDPDPAGRAGLLKMALAGFADEPYAEVADALWAAPEAARLADLRLSAVESFAAAQSELGREAVVVRTLERHVSDHPGRETAACLLAAALYRTGRQAAALETLRRTAGYLTDELGLEPGRPLRDLERDILRQADHLDPIPMTPAAIPITVPEQPSARLRGRRDEIAVIEAAATTAAREGARVVWIGGEAGAGKTTVMEAAATRLRESGWTVAAGRCPEVDGAPPGWAWTEVLGGFAPTLDPGQAQALAPLMHDGRPSGAEGGTFWLAHALADVLGRAAAAAPIAILLDDLHRTDGLTLELLRLITDRLGERPVLVVATYRPSESGAELEIARAALANHTVAHRILAGLDDEATAELAAECGLATIGAETLRLLRERTGGNPLFIRELVRLMVAEGADAAHGGVPVGVRDVLRRRLARLPGATATALRQVAVLGREVDLDLLGEVARRDPDELLDALEPAVLSGLLDEPAPGRIRFAHNLFRDTLYDDTSLLRRSRLHATALELLRRPGRIADAGSLAYHAVAAATTDTAAEAADFAMAAAREADDVGAVGEAVRQWRAAVGMFDLAAVPAVGAVSARCGLVSALARAGDVMSAREQQKRLLAEHADDDSVVHALTAWNAPLVWRLRTGDALDRDIVDPLRRVLGGDHDDVVRTRLLWTAFAEFEGADTPAAVEASGQALDLARGLYAADPGVHGRLLCAALNARAYAALGPDLAGERESSAAELLEVAQACGAVDYQAVAHWLLFLAAAARSDLATAFEHVDLAVARGGTGQLGYLLGVLDVFVGQLTVLSGRPDEGELRYAAAADRLSEHGAANGALMAFVGRMTAALYRGDVAPLADELLMLHRMVSSTMADAAALALASAGRTVEAQQVWNERVPVERSYYWLAMTTLRAHAAAALGDRAVALAAAEELRPYAGRMAGLDNGTLLTGPVDDALAVVAELLGDDDAARRHRAAGAALRERLGERAARLISRTPGVRSAGAAATSA